MKTILITGASGGFGEAIALTLAKQNVKFILTGRNKIQLEKVCQFITSYTASKVMPLVFDIQDLYACKKAINSIPEEFADIDVLINNAGLAVELNTIDKGDYEDWERMINTNIKGLLYTTRLISPNMVAKNSGHIINIGSISSREVYAGGNVYCATKHAVLALSQGMRMDLLPHNIKVTHISPGAAETNFSVVRFHGNKTRADKVYEGFTPLVANDVANVVEYVLSLPEHVCINEINITSTAQFNGLIQRTHKTVEA
ncbi:MAG: SDR family NAD(P)-dependent oxidoreductase [Bacteroidales bacterium]|jgi:NADP-dependent 3-hydroxy acid dehydrogenase YdfG|nr:SDR family NAD(P)-dependent oxidoreductase [Bacteroidales bacterium]